MAFVFERAVPFGRHVGETCTIKGRVYSDHFTFGSGNGTISPTHSANGLLHVACCTSRMLYGARFNGAGTINFGAITSQTANFVQFESIHGLMGMDSLDGATHTIHHMTCTMQHAPCNTERFTSTVQQTTWSMQHTVCMLRRSLMQAPTISTMARR